VTDITKWIPTLRSSLKNDLRVVFQLRVMQ